MQGAVVMFARKPLPRPASRRPARRSRRSFLARLRDDIAIMRMIKLDLVTIARRLGISPEDARDLSPKFNKPAAMPRLTRHAIKALLNGRHAHLGGKAIATRAKNLIRIASAYSFEELLEEPGIGSATATEIHLWIEERGAGLRTD
jgi:hypothetical protein